MKDLGVFNTYFFIRNVQYSHYKLQNKYNVKNKIETLSKNITKSYVHFYTNIKYT